MISSKFYLEAITTTTKSQDGPHKTGEFIFYVDFTFIKLILSYCLYTNIIYQQKMDRDYKKCNLYLLLKAL